MSTLPPGWTLSTLGEIASPGRPRVQPADNPGLPFIGMENIESQTMRLLDTVPATTMKSGAVQFQDGDVLYGRLRPYLNKVHVARFEGLCSAEFIVFPRRDEVSPSWLAYLLNSAHFVKFASHQNAGDRPRVDFGQIGTYPLIVAPRSEQDRIVAEIEKQFSRLDAATAALKRAQANLTRYRASLLKAACEGRLVPTEAELAHKEGRSYEPAARLLERILAERRTRWIAEHGSKKPYKEPAAPDTSNLPPLPEGWAWATVGQVGRIQLGRQRSPANHNGPDMTPYLRVANVFEDRIDTRDLNYMNFNPSEKARFGLRTGDLLLNEGQSLELVGRAAMFRGEVAGCCFQNTLLRFRAYQGLDPNYALSVFLNYLHCGRFRKIARWTTSIAHLGAERLATLEFPMPPVEEQTRIVAFTQASLTDLEHSGAGIARQTERASQLRRSILARAFAGKLVPQDPADEPAAVLLERIRAARATEPPDRKRKRAERPARRAKSAAAGTT